MRFLACCLICFHLATIHADNDYIPPALATSSSQSNSFAAFGGSGNNHVSGPAVSHVKRADGSTLIEIMGKGLGAGGGGATDTSTFGHSHANGNGFQGNEFYGVYGPSNGANGAGYGGSYDPQVNLWGPPAMYEYTVHHGATQRGVGAIGGVINGAFSSNDIGVGQYGVGVDGGYLFRRNY